MAEEQAAPLQSRVEQDVAALTGMKGWDIIQAAMRRQLKQTVPLRPTPGRSRIRRDPPPRPPIKSVKPYPTEREVWAVVAGVILFAIAIAIITVQFSDLTSQ